VCKEDVDVLAEVIEVLGARSAEFLAQELSRVFPGRAFLREYDFAQQRREDSWSDAKAVVYV
jgi:hypothetical protein